MTTTVPSRRFETVTEEKAGGATYTPSVLADFVARQIVEAADFSELGDPVHVLDPGLGEGELLLSFLEEITTRHPERSVELHGFETDPDALESATERLQERFPDVPLDFRVGNFLEHVLKHFPDGTAPLFRDTSDLQTYDVIIANPPYVRTQIMGADQAQELARAFGLSGRVDLYHAFLIAMAWALKPTGIAGIIVSNRFMTTKSGASVRGGVLDEFSLLHAWDLGDTKLFDAAVLPAVLLVRGKAGDNNGTPRFTSIYETDRPVQSTAETAIDALSHDGVVAIDDDRRFLVQHGRLATNGTPNGVWRVATEEADAWLETVEAHAWGMFRDVGNIRVGVKTCADKIFIGSDWHGLAHDPPELLKPVTTHHIARRFRPAKIDEPKQILYPHVCEDGRRRAADLSLFPRSRAYLESHRQALEARSYVIKAGREWYEIWVPQDPGAWEKPKLVFRDISEEPTFWLDLEGSVVNGDCYWLVPDDPDRTDLLWLALAVGNSTFIERFYDYRFHNKLYAGRRRFITQYVEEFPLPDPRSAAGKAIIAQAQEVYECVPSARADDLEKELDTMVWEAFGLVFEEVPR